MDVAGVVVLCVVLVGGCGLVETRTDVVARRSDQIAEPVVPSSIPDTTPGTVADSVPDSTPDDLPGSPDDRQTPVGDPLPPPTVPESGAPLDDAEVDAILADLAANGFCDPADVADDGVVTAMHFVVQGEIREPCYVDVRGDGDDVDPVVVDDDPRLSAAWESLTAVTPVEFLDDISLVAGYEPCSSCDSLAFVSALDTDATFFLLAVDVVAGEDDPDELRLTMMHELSHVFDQAPGTQLDVGTGPDDCATFYNGVGCFTEDSYMWAWIQEFWLDQLDELPADGSVDDDADAEQRCRLDPAYTGSYAAVHPEEDFAETFSAWVYDVVVDPALADKYAFFDRFPELVAIRDNARAAGFAGTESNFEGCGP